jgi:FkbM family methyltransferase
MVERLATRAFQAGAKASAPYQHRGFSVGCRVLAPIVGQRDIVVQLNDDARFAFPFGDGYWSLLLDRSFTYEDDINRVLTAVADADFAFIDCGANFGFWSVLVSSGAYGGHPALAVEPSQFNHARLLRNASLNGDRFKVMHCAIGAARGHAWLHGHKHEALSICPGGDQSASEHVEVVTLDDLLKDEPWASAPRLIVKLDVEGMEIAAIKGGPRLLQRDTMLVVEDHGSDRVHGVSRYLLGETAYRIFVFDPRSERVVPLNDVSLLDGIKANPSIGYNIYATNCRFWEDRLRRLSDGISDHLS